MEFFEARQTFMFSVFNANLQTDMGKTIVRRHSTTTDAQSVWRELSDHMRTSSKGASDKRRLAQYVSNMVLDYNFKQTTEQFVLHYNEQFRQLDEISDGSEKLPPTVKLTVLQTLSEASMIPVLLKLWMNSTVPPMEMDPPHLSHTKHTMISLLMLVLGLIKPKRPT